MNSPFIELFEELLQKYNLPAADVKRFATEFGQIAGLQLLEATAKDLTPEQQEEAKTQAKEGDFTEMIDILDSSYSDEEWNALITKHVEPLLRSYLEEVVQVA